MSINYIIFFLLCQQLKAIIILPDIKERIIMAYILLFLTGILTSITIAIPGVDYAILLLVLGYYHPLIQTTGE